MSHLFEPLSLRSITLKNRIGMSPMCQYSAVDGVPQTWHTVHYGSRALGGAGLVIVEATGVSAEGRISPGCLGLWNSTQQQALDPLRQLIEQQGAVAGIQLAHAGRKASVGLGWQAQRTLTAAEGGWPTVGPSAIAFGDAYAAPAALDETGIQALIGQFAASAQRALAAGFQVVEVHAAHGYLLHQFLSPLANQRTDAYGGSLDNRMRFPLAVVKAVRAVWPDHLPVLVRVSATDWVDGGWTIEDTVTFCKHLKALGVDLVDVSTGGMVPTAKIPAAPGFQAPFAQRIRAEAGLPTATVGLITQAQQADDLLQTGHADLVLLGRELLRNPLWPLLAARELNTAIEWPAQYKRAS
ncbi:NADH:flavin oxidoreductase/NADH oxidase [Limnobacter humi]|uniref:NADH:flavin oxidoreductase/NADH oxidase n=1 Tax=Limnobacter humi TaxID=1778671 RepID=A0ABT1WHG0_9BURK|nr:NADH:flavin oxidoreductase/NADH oxidase [Limnobacter humi]MCQ8896956.1 NADH:flavin oxidoreductase/NADH oxidase [Limnobacter humi]